MSYPSPGPQPPGPSWTATFDPVPPDAPTSPRVSREEELHTGPPAPQGPLSVSQDLPTENLASPPARDALQLRSQDPTPPQHLRKPQKAAKS